MSENRIWLSPPHMGGDEIKYVEQAFSTNWITTAGHNIAVFEKELEKYINENVYATALSSGTASIHLALLVAGISKGDKVLCQSLTFCGSANPIRYVNAEPIFIDSEEKTWNICPALLEEAIVTEMKNGQKPKALIITHLYGMPAQLAEIMDICNHYQVIMIEDAAEALGSSYNGQKCASFGDYGVLSFNGNKIITTSGGGALITKNKKDADRSLFLATQSKEKESHYEHIELGYNYRMSNVLAGIGIGQMAVLPERVQQKRAIYNKYLALCVNLPFQFLLEPPGFISNRWLTCIITESHSQKEKIRQAFEEKNIESRMLWKPMHLQKLYQHNTRYINGTAQKLFEKGLCLPSGTGMGDKEWARIEEVLASIKLENNG